MSLRPRRRHLAAVSILALLVTGAVAAPASARTPDDALVASGEGWTVERAAAGYTVTLRLPKPLPIVSDAPTIVVDGEPLGIARTSDGGRTLTITTPDARVASAREVVKGWASGSGPKAGEDGVGEGERRAPSPRGDEPEQRDALVPTIPVADPSQTGPYAVREAEYDFGDRSVALAGYTDTRGEVAGKLYLTTAVGARPVVLLEHGRHATCGDAASGGAGLAWPCADDEMVIRSYLGYETTARSLASNGYNVISISANAINATDAEFTLDQGAQARGRLVLDTLEMLDRLDRGATVTFEDRPDGGDPVTRTFDDALARATERADQPAAPSGLASEDFDGRFDLSRIGLMGHSRGGEGVVTAAQLNAAAAKPFGIRSVLPLAPTDFARRTLSDVTTMAVLPYCDGDVADQQGQKYVDDSRRAFGDEVLRSAVWVMGANHNFFSSVWTPGEYPAGGSDDWDADDTTSACATTDPTRLTAAEQYQVGATLMTGFFRLTLGGELAYQGIVDGTVAPSTNLTPFADIRVIATQPRSAGDLVTDFAGGGAAVVVDGEGTVEVCEGAMILASRPSCSGRRDAQVPHWNPSFLAPYVPLFPVTRFEWEFAGATALRIPLPEGQRDVRDRSALTLKMAPGDRVDVGTDLAITLVDGSGFEYSTSVSSLNLRAVERMPAGAPPLDKVVLQQVTWPLEDVIGVDLGDLREVRLEPQVGVDGVPWGELYLSDLSFDSPSAGTPAVVARSAVNMAETRVEEQAEPWTAAVAVWLDHPADEPVSAYVGIGPGPGGDAPPAGLGAERVTFAPGQTCLSVPVLIVGNQEPSGAAVSVAGTAVTTSETAVSGANDFSGILVREDDGVAGDEKPAPPFGVQGDVCAELVASRTPGELDVSTDEPARGGTLTLTATGFRAGEAVLATFGDATLPPAIADADGTAVIEMSVAADAVLGSTAVRAEGAGSARVLQATVRVQAASTPTPTPTPTPTATPTSTPTPTSSPTSSPTRSAIAAAVGSDLARTGMDGGLWLLVAVGGALVMASGVAVVAVGNRRRRGR